MLIQFLASFAIVPFGIISKLTILQIYYTSGIICAVDLYKNHKKNYNADRYSFSRKTTTRKKKMIIKEEKEEKEEKKNFETSPLNVNETF